jgi:hypothetical protein
MREKDIKLLWGRSGNRCAICKLEVTPDGQSSSIGEMAHIIARSLDGPRGKSDLSLDDRDLYDNLILLCPNDHAEIDNSPQKWSVELLQRAKMEHEKWVSERLDKGLIFVSPLDNSEFIADRIASWVKFSNGSAWVGVSITPLRLAGDTLDPINPASIAAVNELSVLDDNWSMKSVNRYHTRPNEYGLINDDLQHVERGEGHRIQVFRNGHCELLLNLQESVEQITSYTRGKDSAFGPEDRVIRYTDLAQAVKACIDALYSIWSRLLPFKDMTLSVLVLNTRRCFLYSRELRSDKPLMGYPVESDNLHLSTVIAKNDSPQQIFESVIKQLVTYFGLVLNSIFDEKGELTRPDRLPTGII